MLTQFYSNFYIWYLHAGYGAPPDYETIVGLSRTTFPAQFSETPVSAALRAQNSPLQNNQPQNVGKNIIQTPRLINGFVGTP